MADVRGFNRRALLRAGVAGATALGWPPAFSEPSRPLLLGSASLGSTGYVIIEAFSAILNRHSALRTSSRSTSGGSENLHLIGEGILDLAQSSSPDWAAAATGAGRFHTPIAVRQMFAYSLWATVPIVHADSDIESVQDLAGRRVSPSTAGGSTRTSWDLLTGVLNVRDRIRWTYGSWREIYDAFRARAIDCCPALLVGGRPSPLLQELETSTEIRVLGWPQDAVAAAHRQNAGVIPYQVVPDLWPRLGAPMPCTAAAGILAVHPRVPEHTTYVITRTVFEHLAELKRLTSELRDFDAAFAVRHLLAGMPVSAGAVRYFREAGFWRDELVTAP